MVDPYRDDGSADDAARESARQVRELPFISGGVEIEGAFDASTFVLVDHGLGRDYQGGFVMAHSAPSYVQVALPSEVEAVGADASQKVMLVTGTASSAAFKAWVF